MKYKTYLIILLSAIIMSCSGNEGTNDTPITPEEKPSTETIESASTAITSMKIGWNLGNTLECCSNEGDNWIEKYTDKSPKAYETAWGEPQTTYDMINAFKDAGFNAIRVPVTWWPHMDASDNIDKLWMARVETVIKYVLDNGMYCILNVHHDTGEKPTAWLRADNANFDSTNRRFTALWKQIATHFASYDDHLLFEGYNEMLDEKSNWNAPTDTTAYTALNKLAQSFVNTVRATGGRNAQRNLIVNTYACANGSNDGNKVLSSFLLPKDKTENHLIVGIHSYNPWNWDKDHGKWTAECASDIENMYARLNHYFVSKGIPVIISEYGALNINSSQSDQTEGAKYASCMVNNAKKYGITTFYWMGLMEKTDRATLHWTLPIVKDEIINAY